MTIEDARDTLQELAECLDVVTKSHETMMEIVETVKRIEKSNRAFSMGDAVLEIVWRYMREVQNADCD